MFLEEEGISAIFGIFSICLTKHVGYVLVNFPIAYTNVQNAKDSEYRGGRNPPPRMRSIPELIPIVVGASQRFFQSSMSQNSTK
jgi:hypothetical protein